jgi:hypothetical protein
MRVSDERKKVTVAFKEIREGECFIDDAGDLCMKAYSSDRDYNAIVLESGQIWFANDDTLVERVNAKVVIW